MIKNQICIKSNCRTTARLFTLKAMVKKYKKLYACFVDLKMTIDSVSHIELFKELGRKGINGKLIDLIEDIYKKTKCSVKTNGRITHI